MRHKHTAAKQKAENPKHKAHGHKAHVRPTSAAHSQTPTLPMERTTKPMTEKAAYSRLTALCGRAEQCPADLRRKMSLWQLPEGAEQRLLSQLEKEGYVDERRFAHAFAHDKFLQNRWGRARIAQELRRRAIAQELIEDALTEIPDEESEETLASLLRQRLRTTRGKNDTEVFLKMLRYSVGRGYSPDEAHRCLEKLFKTAPESL